MSNFTISVLQVVKNLANDSTLTIYQQIEKACPLIFNMNYPIWDNGYKRILESKIISRYLNKELCYDNYAMWQFKMGEKLNSIMPYYNQLYLTTIADYEFTQDVNTKDVTNINGTTKDILQVTDVLQTNINGTDSSSNALNGTSNTSNSTNTSNENTLTSTSINSDTPQVQIGVTDYATGITQDNSNNVDVTSSTNNTQVIDSSTGSTSSASNLENNTSSEKDSINDKVEQQTIDKSLKGNTRSVQELIKLQREVLINIDNMIVNDFSDMFIQYYEGR